MIATEDLMTGDWVLYKGQPVMVEEISRPSQKVSLATAHMAAPAVSVNDIEPVPLTAEILSASRIGKTQLMGEQRHFTYQVGPSLSLLAIYDADFSFHIGDSARKILYVHQLQHIIRWCGFESIRIVINPKN